MMKKNFELGKKYKATFIDGSEKTFTFIGGVNPEIKFEDGDTIPIVKLHFIKIEELVED